MAWTPMKRGHRPANQASIMPARRAAVLLPKCVRADPAKLAVGL